MLKIKIQSFGDLITNSSSEVYCIYDLRGVEQVKNAVNEIAKALNPNINVEDHLEIYIAMDEDYEEYDNEIRDYITGQEVYEREYNKFCENRTNEDILRDFPAWYNDFFEDYKIDNNGRPMSTISFNAKDKLGETLQVAIERILNAFEYVEVYNG